VLQKLLISAFVFAFLTCTDTSHSYGQNAPVSPPQFSYGPITDYNSALPATADVLRFRRGERYNIRDSDLPELGENSEKTVLELPSSHSEGNSMPLEQSDAVVIGKVKSAHAYLSNDKRNVYSEFKTSIQEVIKTPNAPYLRAGDSIDVERSGGAIRLPSGKIVLRGIAANSMPLVGGQYLLFLRYDPSTEDYHLETGYQLDGDHAYRLDDKDYVNGHRSGQQHPLREEDTSASQVLSRVRARGAASPTGARQ
jgi:hypothetical protein